jgi:hypothetical protein
VRRLRVADGRAARALQADEGRRGEGRAGEDRIEQQLCADVGDEVRRFVHADLEARQLLELLDQARGGGAMPRALEAHDARGEALGGRQVLGHHAPVHGGVVPEDAGVLGDELLRTEHRAGARLRVESVGSLFGHGGFPLQVRR